VGADVLGDGVEPVLSHGEGPGLVVLGVGLGHVAFAGGGVPPRDLHDGVRHGDGLAEEVDVAGFLGDELAPAHPGLDRGLDHQPVPVGDRGDQEVELFGGQGALLGDDHLGQLGNGRTGWPRSARH
jgi:hypothetical protein